MAAALVRHSSQEEGEACMHLFSRLSLLLLRGNAAILLSCNPQYSQGAVECDQEME